MADKSIPTSFDIEKESEEARKYLEDQHSLAVRVRPLLTLYKDTTKILSVYLPLVDTYEERTISLHQLSWLSPSIGATGVRFVIDTTISFPVPDSENVDKNVLLIFYANSIGCKINACIYVTDAENKVSWQESDIDNREFIKTQEHLVNLLASQMFFSPHPIPFDQHLSYLESKGHEIMYHEPYTLNNINYSQTVS